MIEVCQTEEEIRSVVIDDPEMLERAKVDGFDINTRIIDKGIWLKWVEPGDPEIKALCVFRPSTIYIIDIHVHIPKKFRGSGTLEKGSDFLRWIVSNNKGKWIKFTTYIPVIHRDVILYAMKLGFKKEGINRLSVIKNGQLMDMVMMGMTFEEVK